MEYFLSIPLIPVNFRSFRSSLAFFEWNLSGLLNLGLFLQYRQKPTLHTCKTDETDKKPTNTDVSYAIFVGIS